MNNLVINFYKEHVKKVFKSLKDSDEKVEYLENRVKYLEEIIKKNVVNSDVLLNENINEDPFIKSIINFLE